MREAASPSPIGEYRWGRYRVRYDYARIAPRLGQAPDAELAREISCPTATLSTFRRRMKVRGYQKATRADHLLGKVPDATLARRYRMALATLRKRRRLLGIQRFDRQRYEADRKLRAYVESLDRALNT